MASSSVPFLGWLPRGLAAAPPAWSGLAAPARWRRVLTWSLGLLWLLDAALQYQPYMFSAAFPTQVIAPAGQGSPVWVAAPVSWAAQLLAGHLVLFNALFATVQLLIAVGLFVPQTVRLALAGSIVWSVAVWWLGEGLGGTLAGPVSPLMGLPGAVVLYALVALLVWPARPHPRPGDPRRVSVACAGPLGRIGAQLVWLLLWGSFAFEAVRPAERTPSALHDMIAGMSAGEPRWIATINSGVARTMGGAGTQYSIGLAVLCALIGLSVLIPAATRAGVVVAVAFSLALWIVAEDLGQIATGTGTDPNTGLPLALLALCYWPINTATHPAPTPDAPTDEPERGQPRRRAPGRVGVRASEPH